MLIVGHEGLAIGIDEDQSDADAGILALWSAVKDRLEGSLESLVLRRLALEVPAFEVLLVVLGRASAVGPGSESMAGV